MNQTSKAKNYLQMLALVAPLGIFAAYCTGPILDASIAGAMNPIEWRSFDSKLWKAQQSSRPSMVFDVVFWRKLVGVNQDQLLYLLGPADGPYGQLGKVSAEQNSANQGASANRNALTSQIGSSTRARGDYMLQGTPGCCSYLYVNYNAHRQVESVSVLEQSPF